MGLLSTHIFKKFCVFSIFQFYSRSFVETLHFPSFLQGFCGKKRTLSVIAARCQIPPFVAARHLFLSLSPAVTFLPGAGRICPGRGKSFSKREALPHGQAPSLRGLSAQQTGGVYSFRFWRVGVKVGIIFASCCTTPSSLCSAAAASSCSCP